MRARGVAVQGALAGVALLAAYLTWQREPEGAAGDVTVLDVPRRALQRVAYEDDARAAELFREADGALWVRLTEKPPRPQPAPDAGVPGAADAGAKGLAGLPPLAAPDAGVRADAGVATVAAAPPPPRVLRAAPNAEEAFGRFAPLRAARALGVLEGAKLAELGLAGSARSLVVTHAGGREAFEVASAASGWASPYVRRTADGRVFLLGPGVLTDLETAHSRLVDRRLHALEAARVERVEVEAGGKRAAFVARPAPAGVVGPALTLAPQGTPDAPDAFATQWADRVMRLYPVELLGRGEAPPGGEPQVAFRVTWRRGDAALESVTVARGEGGSVWARSGFTAGWVRLAPAADTLVGEAARVAGGT